MKSILLCVCYPFAMCCPCVKDQNLRTDRTKQTGKTPKTGQTRGTAETSDKTDKTTKTAHSTKTVKTTTKEVSDKSRHKKKKKTKEKTDQSLREDSPMQYFNIPEHFKSIEDCFESQGFEKQDLLGKGGFGEVYKVVELKSKQRMACKIVKFNGDADSPKNPLSELKLMIKATKIRNDNIIQVLNHFILRDLNRNTNYCMIFMEFANGGCILDRMRFYVNDNLCLKPIIERTAKDYFRQTANGLQFLHCTHGIAHKDIKLQNILVFLSQGSKDVIKITDFGLSGIRYDTKRQVVIKDSSFAGTLEYMSPQILRLHIYHLFGKKVDKLKEYDAFKADSWALGVCLYYMISTNLPFPPKQYEEDMIEMYNNMTKSNYTITDKMKKNYSNECLDMIKELLVPDPNARIPINTVLSHRWLTH